jgi:hypothetical protein
MQKVLGAIVGAIVMSLVSPALADEEAPHRTINVRDHGAVCNGQHDDTQGFRKAIEKAPIGGTVSVPPGRCVISDTVVINATNAVSIVGAGRASQIYQRAQRTLFEFQGVDALSIRDLYLGSVSTAAGTALIKLTNSHHMRVDNVTMLGGNIGLYLSGSLLNTIVDLRSGTNFGNFFAPTSVNQLWVYGERFNNISSNANTFISPVLEGGVNGIYIKDTSGEGSLNITGGSIEGLSGTGLMLEKTTLPSSITGMHFEQNGVADIVLQAATNVRISSVLSLTYIKLMGDTRNVTISDTTAQNIYIEVGDGGYTAAGPTIGTGAKRIILQNITTCVGGTSSIIPPPTLHTNLQGDGDASPVINNPNFGTPRRDIIYVNIGYYCGGG